MVQPAALRAARDFLIQHRDDYPTAHAGFTWPDLPVFNFATDWFDGLAEENPDGTALWVIDGEREEKLSFAELSARSVAVAHLLADLGLRRGDRLLLVLGNIAPLWEIMLGAIRLGAVIIPAAQQLAATDLADRIDRGGARLLVAQAADAERLAELRPEAGRILVGAEGPVDGWVDYGRAEEFRGANPHLPGASKSGDPLLLYFTSGTTAQPKLVQHTQISYPIGHLSTMYWIGLKPGDIHLNAASPGWAKHAWSSFFAPWLAGATIVVYNYARFDPNDLMRVLERTRATTLCAPPTVWRMLVQADLTTARHALRECVSAGEPLNPEVIEKVRQAWHLTIRDGYGQTETTAQIGNPPGQPLKPGSMGRPLPGYVIKLIDPATGQPAEREGELCLELTGTARSGCDSDPGPAPDRPLPLMTGYQHRAGEYDSELNDGAFAGGVYHTGDVVEIDDEGYLTFIGRADDVFKASGYRISPFELESVLIEHPAVAEAAVVPSPDPIRHAVPKAYVVLAAGHAPDADTARSILAYVRDHAAPYKRIRKLEFTDLPKTISGKIRRVELRTAEDGRDGRAEGEFYDSDFAF
ncbi:AMP-binding protein [Microlunatus parietis]|uniref:Acetyl-CoA synthetase n=1 Tax=Microlunatus parietis TaxID=682979 RepID=A0A7Y9LD27_9ACTN|nr:AMP-binding protein [Microlunatus parietis]NYE75464.1 acetyl-CoA synthetase [Microlunatus parietis]